MDIQIFAGDNPDIKRFNNMALGACAHFKFKELNMSFAMQFKHEPKQNDVVVANSLGAAKKDWDLKPQRHVHVTDMLPGENLKQGLTLGINMAKSMHGGFSMKQDGICVVVTPQHIDAIHASAQLRENIINKMWEFLDGTCTKPYKPQSNKYEVGPGLI